MASEAKRRVYVVEWHSEVSGKWYVLTAYDCRSLAWQDMAERRKQWKSTEKRSSFRTTPYVPEKEAAND